MIQASGLDSTLCGGFSFPFPFPGSLETSDLASSSESDKLKIDEHSDLWREKNKTHVSHGWRLKPQYRDCL